MTIFTPFKYAPLKPFGTFNSYLKEIENDLLGSDHRTKRVDFFPAANVIELDKDYAIELELPAVEKKDVEISFKDNVLSVKGSRHNTHKEQEDKYIRLESHYGTFERQWSFEDVATDKISAQFENGLLKIVLPKKPEAIASREHKKIAIQ